ncbi:MAG: TlpA disulfide reductase family protein [Myxococcota bacterium]|jgi:thiol-disulfide isomerase/thioredoxin|nr:TlpA disulfide reductase family protein [Myxococcota bacterium]
MTTSSQQRDQIARAFVGFAVLLLTGFVLVQLWLAVDARSPERRVRELMPAVKAQSVDLPLTDAQLDYPLQAPPRKGSQRGGEVTLRDYAQGKLLILNFWATWCEPCVRELPSMLELRRTLADSRVRMVGISYDDGWKTLLDFFRRMVGGMPREIDIAIDPAGENPGSLRLHFGTRKLPETYVIVDGHVLARFVNERDWTDPAMVEYFQRLVETLQ